MSFSDTAKREIIASRSLQNPCCAVAACYGVACFSKHFGAGGVVLHTEREFVARHALDIFSAAGIAGSVSPRGAAARGYEFSVTGEYETEKLLAMFGHSGAETALRINRENIFCAGCFSAFCASAFLCAGVVPDPGGGYLLELVSPRYSLMGDFELLLREHGFTPGRAVRKGSNVLYFKASEQIEDLLTTMCAPQAALEIMSMKVYRDLRNKANRITNCETANIDKSVQAGGRALRAISLLRRRGALDALPAPLRAAAYLRLENPGLSLAELAGVSGEAVSKSALSRRYGKICELARQADVNSPKDEGK